MKTYKITVNGQSYEVQVEEASPSTTVVQPDAVSAAAAPAVPATPAAPAASSVPATPTTAAAPTAPSAPAEVTRGSAQNSPKSKVLDGEVIKAPMPGTILSVKVQVGDTVDKGTVLCILEAMKMENEIMAGRPGTVTAIAVETGASVNPGDPLLSIS